MIRRVLLLALWSCLAAAAPKKAKKPLPAPPPPPTAPMSKVVENVTPKVTRTLEAATRVQVWRVGGSGGLRPDPTRAIGSDFQREEAGRELTGEALKALRGILYDERSYRWDTDVSRCNFEPDVSFQAQSGLDTIEALVSFRCNQVFFFAGKPGGRWIPGGAFDVKPARKELLELAKVALSDDPATQAIR